MGKQDHDLNEMVQFAMDIVRESGEKALAYYGKGKHHMKFDEGLIIETELSLTNFFNESLRAHYPEHQVFRNNIEDKDYTHDQERFLWVFDPMDGVANIQAGIPIWSISLALLDNFWPIFGVVYMPATGDFFSARAGEKAYRGEREIRISDQEAIDDESLLFTFSRFHHYYQTSFRGKIRNLGCTDAHICYVAMGRAEAAIIANESFQDLAAARIIIESAGGQIFKMDGSRFYLNDHLDGITIDDHLLVTGPRLCSQVCQSLGTIR